LPSQRERPPPASPPPDKPAKTKPPVILPATHLHQEAVFKATPDRIYAALTDAPTFGKMTAAPAEISPEPGGAFSLFGARIVGRNIELVPHQRLVQAWHSQGWASGAWSIIRFEIQKQGSETRLILDHTGFPDASAESLRTGWHEHYWEPLKKFFI
jgi:activator of HSP90 ATPase